MLEKLKGKNLTDKVEKDKVKKTAASYLVGQEKVLDELFKEPEKKKA